MKYKAIFSTLASDEDMTQAVIKGEQTPKNVEEYIERRDMVNKVLAEKGIKVYTRQNPYSLVGPTFFSTQTCASREEGKTLLAGLQEVQAEVNKRHSALHPQ